MTAKAIGLRLDPNVYACIIQIEDVKHRRIHFPFLYFHPPAPRNRSPRTTCPLTPDPPTTAPFPVRNRGLRFRLTSPRDGAGRTRLVITPSLALAAAPAPRSRVAREIAPPTRC